MLLGDIYLARELVKVNNSFSVIPSGRHEKAISEIRINDVTETIIIPAKRIHSTILSEELGGSVGNGLLDDLMHIIYCLLVRNQLLTDFSCDLVQYILNGSIKAETTGPLATRLDDIPDVLGFDFIEIEFNGGAKLISPFIILGDVLGDIEGDGILIGEKGKRPDMLEGIIRLDTMTGHSPTVLKEFDILGMDIVRDKNSILLADPQSDIPFPFGKDFAEHQ